RLARGSMDAGHGRRSPCRSGQYVATHDQRQILLPRAMHCPAPSDRRSPQALGLRHEIVEIGAFNDRHGGLSHDALAPSKRRRHTAAAPINGPPLPSEVAAMVVALESTRPQFRRTVAWMVGMNRSAESITLPPSTTTSGAKSVTRLATPIPR